MSNNKFIVVVKNAVNRCDSADEAFEVAYNLQNINPNEEYEILEVHPPRPKGLGGDPDLYD